MSVAITAELHFEGDNNFIHMYVHNFVQSREVEYGSMEGRRSRFFPRKSVFHFFCQKDFHSRSNETECECISKSHAYLYVEPYIGSLGEDSQGAKSLGCIKVSPAPSSSLSSAGIFAIRATFFS